MALTETLKEEFPKGVCPYCGEPFSLEQIEKVGKRIKTCGSEGCQQEHELIRNKNKDEARRNEMGLYVSPRPNRSQVTKQHNRRKQWTEENPPPKAFQCANDGCWNRKEISSNIFCANCEIEKFCGDDHPLREVFDEIVGLHNEADYFYKETRISKTDLDMGKGGLT